MIDMMEDISMLMMIIGFFLFMNGLFILLFVITWE